MVFRWRANGGRLIMVFGSSHPSSTLKKQQHCHGWTPSDKIFWIRTSFAGPNSSETPFYELHSNVKCIHQPINFFVHTMYM